MIWTFLLLCLVSYVHSDTECYQVSSHGDRRKDANTLRLVQYNAEWLFMDYYSPMDCPGNGCTWKSTSDADTHMNYVAKVLTYLNPDIINMCEVEGCDELELLREKMNDTSYVPYLKFGTDTSTGQNVGMLTRIDPVSDLFRTEERSGYPLPDSACGYTGPAGTTGLSKHYITEFNVGNISIAFISAHLLAYPTDATRCAEREAQAYLIQTIIYNYISNGFEIMVLGDFNDYDAEIMDVNNHIPISRVLDIIKGNYTGLYRLYNVAEGIEQDQRYSDWWDSDGQCDTSSPLDYSLIDHILVSDKLQHRIHNAFIYHNYSEFCGKFDSDHYPVVIDLLLN